MPPDFSDPKVVKQATIRAKAQENIDNETLKHLMNSTSGRSFIWRKLEGCHLFATSYSDNPVQMAFNEGQRNQGLELYIELMRACPDQYVQMWREANARDTATQRALEQDGNGRDQEPDEQQLNFNLPGVSVDFEPEPSSDSGEAA